MLRPVAVDEDLVPARRAEAWVLIAQAHFGIAAPDADERARLALQKAFKLDIDVELSDRADVSPKLVALFDDLHAAALQKKQGQTTPGPGPDRPPRGDDDPPATSPADPNSDPPQAGSAPSFSPWWIGAGVAGGVALAAGVVVVGSELWLGDVAPGTPAGEVRATQGIGTAGVVVGALSVTAAVVAGVVGLLARE